MYSANDADGAGIRLQRLVLLFHIFSLDLLEGGLDEIA